MPALLRSTHFRWIEDMKDWITPRRFWASISLFVCTIVGCAGMAQAQGTISAIIEDVGPGITDRRAFDTLREGDVIQLGQGQTLTLGYLNSCVREVVVSGKITIGAKESQVEGGSVDRSTIQCAVAKLDLKESELSQSAIMAFRPAQDEPIREIYVSEPIVVARQSQAVLLTSMDGAENLRKLLQTDRGRIDFANEGIALKPGHVYRLQGLERSLILQVSANVERKDTTLERVVILD